MLVGEFGELLLADYISVVPDEHTDCESGYVLGQLVAVARRYLKRWCLAGRGAPDAWIAAGFLIECMQEVDQVSQFLADIRGKGRGRPTYEVAGAAHVTGAQEGDGLVGVHGQGIAVDDPAGCADG
ncbi:hypothetical protein ACGFNQ_35960 [Streptomyces asoensis]|uniref:hypothetical protein n=1 Tax=Streptomyces asoensis TaxID=249586 RepID=UPI003718250A